MPTTLRLRCLAVLSVTSLLVFTGGCASDSDGPRPGAARRKPATPLAGHESFFDGKILAEIHVGSDGMPEPGSGGERGSGGEGRGGRRGGGGGRMRMSGGNGGMGMGGDVSGNVPFGGGGREGGGMGPRPAMMGGRPVLIHLRFTNQGATAATIRILDFVSPLGNFVVRPDHVTVEPGQSLEVDPMSSELAGEIGGTDATLRLRVGDQTEKKTFPLAVVPPPEQAPAPADAK